MGQDTDEGGGEGDYKHWDHGDAHFRLCVAPGGLGCIQHAYPWVDKRQYANGTIWDDVGEGED